MMASTSVVAACVMVMILVASVKVIAVPSDFLNTAAARISVSSLTGIVSLVLTGVSRLAYFFSTAGVTTVCFTAVVFAVLTAKFSTSYFVYQSPLGLSQV